MPDRNTPPPIRPVSQISLPAWNKLELSHQVPMYHLAPSGEEVMRLDILMDAGRPREMVQLASRMTGSMLKEGTRSYTGAQIAEQLDFHGASLSVPFQMDGIHLVVHMLTRHAARILPVVASVLLEPVFPEDELVNLKERYIQQMEVELAKADVVAYREFTQRLFGMDHPYGYNSSPNGYRALQRSMLLDHYQAYFRAGNCKLILSGGAREEELRLIDELICRPMPTGEIAPLDVPEVTAPDKGFAAFDLPSSLQTALRLGRRVPSRRHPDYPGLYVLNTILGGYFGSRLMTNIREEKGFTYNIFSSLDSMRMDSYFYIGTEVGNEHVDATRREIIKEMRRLREEEVPAEELMMVKNYILGSFLTMLDGPFQTADLIKGLLIEDLPLSAFTSWVDQIKEIEEKDIQRLAKEYLHPGDMWEVIVGKNTH